MYVGRNFKLTQTRKNAKFQTLDGVVKARV